MTPSRPICERCRTYTRDVFLERVDGSLVCPNCVDDLQEEAGHVDDVDCGCRLCGASNPKPVMYAGGLSEFGLTVLGLTMEDLL